MDNNDTLCTKAEASLVELLSSQESAIWYYGILIAPDITSSLAYILGIESMDDLVLFLSFIGLVHKKSTGEYQISLKSSAGNKNGTRRRSWNDLMIQHELDPQCFTRQQVGFISNRNEYWIGIGKNDKKPKPTPLSQFESNTNPPPVMNTQSLKNLRSNIKLIIKSIKSPSHHNLLASSKINLLSKPSSISTKSNSIKPTNNGTAWMANVRFLTPKKRNSGHQNA